LWVLGALENGANVPGLGDMGEVKLRLQVVAVARLTPVLTTTPSTMLLLEMGAHTYRLVFLDGGRVRLLLGDADLGKYVKDGLALYF
jgi:hypothetical protein